MLTLVTLATLVLILEFVMIGDIGGCICLGIEDYTSGGRVGSLVRMFEIVRQRSDGISSRLGPRSWGFISFVFLYSIGTVVILTREGLIRYCKTLFQNCYPLYLKILFESLPM